MRNVLPAAVMEERIGNEREGEGENRRRKAA